MTTDPTMSKVAWLYCRKSSVEARGIDDDAKSVERQETNGRIDAGALGATVTEVFKDDAISGAETRRLRDKQRMLALIRSGVKPDFLIMQKSDRLVPSRRRRGGRRTSGDRTRGDEDPLLREARVVRLRGFQVEHRDVHRGRVQRGVPADDHGQDDRGIPT